MNNLLNNPTLFSAIIVILAGLILITGITYNIIWLAVISLIILLFTCAWYLSVYVNGK